MSRYNWLKTEVGAVRRRKFHVLEPQRLEDLERFESNYGLLPSDYREFVMEFGASRFFRSSYGFFYNLQVLVPPKVDCLGSPAQNPQDSLVRLVLGHCVNTGDVWLEWGKAGFVHNGAVLSGLSGQRPRNVGAFDAWLLRSFKTCRKLYSREEWAAIKAPAVPFTPEEHRVLCAIPMFTFRKVGVSLSGAIFVEVSNQSAIELPFLSVGVRAIDGMEGSVALPVAGIKPGSTKTLEVFLYKGCMDPDGVSLFRLPIPDEEDRQFYLELRPHNGKKSDTRLLKS